MNDEELQNLFNDNVAQNLRKLIEKQPMPLVISVTRLDKDGNPVTYCACNSKIDKISIGRRSRMAHTAITLISDTLF